VSLPLSAAIFFNISSCRVLRSTSSSSTAAAVAEMLEAAGVDASLGVAARFEVEAPVLGVAAAFCCSACQKQQ